LSIRAAKFDTYNHWTKSTKALLRLIQDQPANRPAAIVADNFE